MRLASSLAVILSVLSVLMVSGCSSQTSSNVAAVAFRGAANTVMAQPWQDYFPDGGKAVVASQERVWEGAQKAVKEGLPLFVGEAPGAFGDVEKLSGEAKEDAPDDLVAAIAALDPAAPDSDGPVVLATAASDPTQVATARAAGAQIEELPVGDPRASSALTSGKQVVGLGSDFGTSERFADLVQLGSYGQVPGGGELLFPGRRMVALYGHPSGAALGALGEQPPAESVERVKELAAQYQPMESQPVVPAFEVIATVASSDPGPDGNYSAESDVEELRPYVEAITQAGGYAVLDLQPGRASFLEQAQLYQDLLRLPGVGLALDPEWQIGPDEAPMQRVGNTTAAQVNEVADWLSGFVRENRLPQKVLMLHQFQTQMIQDREAINTAHPELAFVLHADGHGTAEDKFYTWAKMREGLSPDYAMGWKNFIDEDTPMFTPEQTYDSVDPRPSFVSYQ
ncbi:cell wall-binding repeat-containing protein [Corynebacterium vitaeruminis]|uniref:cell wall-binding repeat-containing protein n=1 Tax=Corynebacterium vitaeruminis TaxID=38305 RepID=UPI0035E42EEA